MQFDIMYVNSIYSRIYCMHIYTIYIDFDISIWLFIYLLMQSMYIIMVCRRRICV